MERYKMFAMITTSLGLMFLVVGVTYAFFNYTRTGNENTLGTGRIYFNTTEGTALNLTNVFPVDSTEASNANLDSLTIGIEGDTNYTDGEEFEISIVDVNNVVNGKEVPMNFIATYEATTGNTIGTSSDNYMTARNSKDATIYNLTTTGEIEENKQILVGYIDNGATGINGTLTIKAYVDADRIAISDTYNGPSATPNDNNGTTNEWVNGRTVFTTTEWNSLNSNSISFKIKAESQEGIWVYPKIATCPGCKFIFPHDPVYIVGNEYDEEPTVLTNGVSDNYLDVMSSSEQDFFMGVILNSSNQVTKAYVCGTQNNNMFCIDATDNGANYEANKELLQSKKYWNNNCIIESPGQAYESVYCPQIDKLDLGVGKTGGAMARDDDGGFCSVDNSGCIHCYATDPN
jgi:hypothetical protein